MAEGILHHLSKGQMEVFSAGSEPEAIHPLAIRVLRESGVDIRQQRSKHLDEFRGQKFDYILTVCDRVREVCPVFPGDPEQIHWSFPDPAEVEGEPARLRAFNDTAKQLITRLNYLLLMIEREGKFTR
jgi:protein-tyrosine-phosphatase